MRIKELFLVLLFPALAFAQEGLPFYRHYLVVDKYLINPSYAAVDPDILSVSASYRNQWDNLPQSPNTQTISGHTRVGERLGAGAYFFRDENGPISLAGINLTASYHIPLESGDYYDNNGFSFGLSYNGFGQTFDLSQLNPAQPGDPTLQNDSYFLHYFNVGGNLRINGFQFGVSVLDVPLLDNRPIANNIEPLPTWFYFLASYRVRLADGIHLEPNVAMNLNTNSERHLDANMLAHIGLGGYDDDQALTLGVSYRQDLDESGSQALSVSPLMRIKVGSFRAGMTYDIGLSDIANEGGNGILFGIGYDFGAPFTFR